LTPAVDVDTAGRLEIGDRQAGRSFANNLNFQLQLDDWFERPANRRHDETLRCRPVDRLVDERRSWCRCPSPPGRRSVGGAARSARAV
jgi:hypothetical protein